MDRGKSEEWYVCVGRLECVGDVGGLPGSGCMLVLGDNGAMVEWLIVRGTDDWWVRENNCTARNTPSS